MRRRNLVIAVCMLAGLCACHDVNKVNTVTPDVASKKIDHRFDCWIDLKEILAVAKREDSIPTIDENWMIAHKVNVSFLGVGIGERTKEQDIELIRTDFKSYRNAEQTAGKNWSAVKEDDVIFVAYIEPEDSPLMGITKTGEFLFYPHPQKVTEEDEARWHRVLEKASSDEIPE